MFPLEIKRLLQNSRLFRYLDARELDILLPYCKLIHFADKELVFRQGQKSLGLYLIVEGKALLTAKTLGKDFINLATISPGNFVGEVSLIEKSRYTASVIADGTLQCLQITSEYFDMLGVFLPEIHYKITKAIIEEVCERLKESHQKMISYMKSSDMAATSIMSSFITSFRDFALQKTETISFEHAHLDLKQLKNAYFFHQFSAEEYDELIKHFILIKAPANYPLIKTGDKDVIYYVIVAGAVQLTIREQNKIAKLAVWGPTVLLGNMFYINNSPSLIDYTTCERSLLLKITATELEKLRQNNIQVWYKIWNTTCKSFIAAERAAAKLNIRLHSETYNV